MIFENRSILITGGTGSLGSVLLRRLLSGEKGMPRLIRIFSRDEAKQSALKAEIGDNKDVRIEFQIGDIRDYSSVETAIKGIDVIFNAAALKQVPSCEYSPYEAIQTNVTGPENIVRAVQNSRIPAMTVIGISTDKAVAPINVMGASKMIQERIFLSAEIRCPGTRFVCVRYGNVLASRGSVIPLFKEQIKRGGPVTVTTREMTRFLLTLDKAVDTVFAAVETGISGETFIPRIPSARVMDIAYQIIGRRDIKIEVVGIRPGEKIHEVLVSQEEIPRTYEQGDYYVISSILSPVSGFKILKKEFNSEDALMGYDDLRLLLNDNGFLND